MASLPMAPMQMHQMMAQRPPPPPQMGHMFPPPPPQMSRPMPKAPVVPATIPAPVEGIPPVPSAPPVPFPHGTVIPSPPVASIAPAGMAMGSKMAKENEEGQSVEKNEEKKTRKRRRPSVAAKNLAKSGGAGVVKKIGQTAAGALLPAAAFVGLDRAFAEILDDSPEHIGIFFFVFLGFCFLSVLIYHLLCRHPAPPSPIEMNPIRSRRPLRSS